MKILLLLACVSSAVVALEFQKSVKEKVAAVMPECISEVGATEEDVAEVTARRVPTRKEGRCLASCLLKKFDLQGANGELSSEGSLKTLDPLEAENRDLYSKLIEVGGKCSSIIRAMNIQDHCDIAVEISRCVITEAKAVGIDDPFMF